jgi:hypothetical protein
VLRLPFCSHLGLASCKIRHVFDVLSKKIVLVRKIKEDTKEAPKNKAPLCRAFEMQEKQIALQEREV